MKHWREIQISPKHIKLDPRFWVGLEKQVQTLSKDKKGRINWKDEMVYFDYDFIVFFLCRVLFQLMPLSSDKIKILLEDVYREYETTLAKKQEENAQSESKQV